MAGQMNIAQKAPALAAGLLVAILATVVLRPFIENERTSAKRENLAAYVEERASGRNTFFEEARIVQETARDQFQRHYADLDQARIDAIFTDRFPVFDAGTRRSRDEDFDGRRTEDGHLVYGMGAFLGATQFTPTERREVVAAYLAITAVGPGVAGLFDSLYFNDDGDRLVIFAPNRDDRLEFYRRTAPDSFEFSNASFVEIAQPSANPNGQFACTALTDLLYRQDERMLTIGCHLPVRHVGRHVGAFGMTLDVRDYLFDAVVAPSGREAMVVSRDGAIVAHRALFQSDIITQDDVDAVLATLNLDRLVSAVTGNGQPHAVIDDPTQNGLAAFVKLEAPGWFLVIREPGSVSASQSWLQAGLLGAVGGFLVFFQILMLPARLPRLHGKAATPET
jgi:hypothetical protein